MLIDETEITLTAGRGGRGAVAWNNIKLHRGPVGGSGGRGASIYFEATSDVTLLNQFRSKRMIHAEDGENGKGQFRDGHNADDLVLKIPAGTIITNLDTGVEAEVAQVGERLLAVQGGIGGRGNFHFKSSTNQAPLEFEEGTEGEEFSFRLDLKLIADVGIIGLPNAGKSSLLNALTEAKGKVGNYAFTTLEPNLGSYYGLILADIPGLIEGAAEGKGLGTKFLKHIERTQTLLHLISAEADDPARDYQTIKNELIRYSPILGEKVEHTFLTKSDAVSPEALRERLAALEEAGIKAVPITLYDEKSLEPLKEVLNQLKDAKGV